MLPKPQYNAIVGAFEKLWGERQADQISGASIDGVAVLTEANFM